MTMNILTEFDKYFSETCNTINKKIMDNYLNNPHIFLSLESSGGIFRWAQENEPELYNKEEHVYSLIDLKWPEGNVLSGVEGDKFKKTVLEWGRVVLKIYKKYSESQRISGDCTSLRAKP